MRSILVAAAILAATSTAHAETLTGDLRQRPDGTFTLVTPHLQPRQYIKQYVYVLTFTSKDAERKARGLVGQVVTVSGHSDGSAFRVGGIR